jgi:hypothetical protein
VIINDPRRHRVAEVRLINKMITTMDAKAKTEVQKQAG